MSDTRDGFIGVVGEVVDFLRKELPRCEHGTPCGFGVCVVANGLANRLQDGLAKLIATDSVSLEMALAWSKTLKPDSVFVIEARGEKPSIPLLEAAREIEKKTKATVIVTTPGRRLEVLDRDDMWRAGWVRKEDGHA